jgi:hypothetical protein
MVQSILNGFSMRTSIEARLKFGAGYADVQVSNLSLAGHFRGVKTGKSALHSRRWLVQPSVRAIGIRAAT